MTLLLFHCIPPTWHFLRKLSGTRAMLDPGEPEAWGPSPCPPGHSQPQAALSLLSAKGKWWMAPDAGWKNKAHFGWERALTDVKVQEASVTQVLLCDPAFWMLSLAAFDRQHRDPLLHAEGTAPWPSRRVKGRLERHQAVRVLLGRGCQCRLGVECSAGFMLAPEEDSLCIHSPMLWLYVGPHWSLTTSC